MDESFKQRGETILVVDDTDITLNLVASILKTANFTVLGASNGPAALELAATYSERIDLLLSDVQMPGMSGPDLGKTLKRSRPDMHVMLMSGLPGGEPLALNYGWAFIQKPFVPSKLLEMVNVVLHTLDKSQYSHQ